MRRAAIVLATALAVLVLAPWRRPARADAVEATAQAHVDRGVAAFEARLYEVATREFAAAVALVPARANPHRWLGLTRLQLGDCAGAVPELAAFLARAAPDDPRVAEALRLQDECRRTGTLVVTTRPGGATVRLDGGAIVGTTPYLGRATPVGAHLLELAHDGYVAETRSVVVPAAATLTVDVTLRSPRATSRRWWIVGAAVVGAALVTGAVLVLTHDGTATLPPVRCDGAGACT
jgi:hypothetical protein